jgi:hypothetical protein
MLQIVDLNSSPGFRRAELAIAIRQRFDSRSSFPQASLPGVKFYLGAILVGVDGVVGERGDKQILSDSTTGRAKDCSLGHVL